MFADTGLKNLTNLSLDDEQRAALLRAGCSLLGVTRPDGPFTILGQRNGRRLLLLRETDQRRDLAVWTIPGDTPSEPRQIVIDPRFTAQEIERSMRALDDE